MINSIKLIVVVNVIKVLILRALHSTYGQVKAFAFITPVMEQKYRYTQTWFFCSEIRQQLHRFLFNTEPNSILEIGSFEGLSSCFLADNFLGHQSSSLICVDPFDTNDKTTPLTDSTKGYFLDNIAKSVNAKKVTFHQQYSNQFFAENTKTFNFIYVDGSHELNDIRYDMREAFKVLRQGGIMWMDDYLGGGSYAIKAVMDEFVTAQGSNVDVVWKGYQLALRKLSP